MPSSSGSSSSSRPVPAEASSTSPLTRPRRPRRVLYPAWQSRRPHLREAVDPARRGLLVLSALVFLQIYTEETHTCTDLQSQCPEPATCPSQEGDGSPGAAHGWMEEEPRKLQMMHRASEHQMECTVA